MLNYIIDVKKENEKYKIFNLYDNQISIKEDIEKRKFKKILNNLISRINEKEFDLSRAFNKAIEILENKIIKHFCFGNLDKNLINFYEITLFNYKIPKNIYEILKNSRLYREFSLFPTFEIGPDSVKLETYNEDKKIINGTINELNSIANKINSYSGEEFKSFYKLKKLDDFCFSSTIDYKNYSIYIDDVKNSKKIFENINLACDLYHLEKDKFEFKENYIEKNIKILNINIENIEENFPLYCEATNYAVYEALKSN